MPLRDQDEGRALWLPPGTMGGHLVTCARCGDSIERGKVVFWQHEDDAETSPVTPFCPPCAYWYRENQWWRPIYRRRAEDVLNEYTTALKHRGKWEQWEIDAKAERFGLEPLKKHFRGGL